MKRGHITITQDGLVEGGNCDEAHWARAEREKGARMYLQRLEQYQKIQSNHGWLRISQHASIPEKNLYSIGVEYSSEVAVGYRQFRKDVVEQLIQQKKAFRQSWMQRWIEDISSFEFGVNSETPLSILGVGKFEYCYTPPREETIYQKRKARGEFKTV